MFAGGIKEKIALVFVACVDALHFNGICGTKAKVCKGKPKIPRLKILKLRISS